MRHVLLISGILGLRREGNQSLRNTIEGLLTAGYRVRHFSMTSVRDRRQQYGRLLDHPHYRHWGFPQALMGVLKALGGLRSSVSVSRPGDRAGGSVGLPALTESVDLGETEVDRWQVAVALASACFDVVRGLLAAASSRPALVYGYETFGGLPASIIGGLLRVPVVLRFQGTYLTHRNRWRPGLRFHARVMRGHADGIIMANDGTRGRDVLRRLGIPAGRIFFEPNGLDDLVWKAGRSGNDAQPLPSVRQSLDPTGSRYLLGIFTRFYPYKRIDRAILLLQRFRSEGAPVHLAIGGGGGPLEGRLRQLIADRGLEAHVSWLGPIAYAQMPDCYRACDAILVMNDCANTGNQIFETIHLGVPLIAVDDGVNSTLFGDCPFARFVRIADLPALSWSDVLVTIEQRGARYRCAAIRSWAERMQLEVRWIEQTTAAASRRSP